MSVDPSRRRGIPDEIRLGTLPTESVLRLWDALILEGGEILAPFSILVLKSVKDELMNTDPTTVMYSLTSSAANMFDIGEIIMDAIVSARDLSGKFDSLSIRLGEREVTADVLNNLNSFQAAVNSLSESADPRASWSHGNHLAPGSRDCRARGVRVGYL